MRRLLLLSALSACIFGAAGTVARAVGQCDDVALAYEKAVAAASVEIANLRAEVAALREQLRLQQEMAEAVRANQAATIASYERELAATRRELGASRWRRLLDSLIIGGAGFTVGAAVGD